MKKSLILMLSVLMGAAVGLFALSACTQAEEAAEEVESKVEEVVADVKADFETIVADAKAEAAKIEEVTEDDVKEAYEYIEEHIVEPFENSDITKGLISAANKLKAWGEQTEEAASHDLAVLGQNVHDFFQKVIQEGEDVEGEVATGIKNTIDNLTATISADKDALVSEFYSLFHKN